VRQREISVKPIVDKEQAIFRGTWRNERLAGFSVSTVVPKCGGPDDQITIATAHPAGRGDIMARLVDRLLARVAPKATAAAGCSNYYYCSSHNYYLRQCCLNEGCTTVRVGSC
jgi:hypothetical protein